MAENRFNHYCETLLVKYNQRNSKAITRHVESLCNVLRQETDEVVQVMFRGSIMRSTDVNSLSDVDVLLIVNQSSLASLPTAEAIEYVKDIVVRRMSQNLVRTGKLAVTVDYSDGSEIQLLPAIRTQHGVGIAEPGNTKWSDVIQPDKFATRLAKVNEARNGRVVPTIKLAKSIVDCFITRPSRKISGYHMEALAIEDLQSAAAN